MGGVRAPLALGALIVAAVLGCAGGAGAVIAGPAEPPPDLGATPAVRYGALDRGACVTEVARRGVPWKPIDSARGVLAPGRLTGELHGVTFHTGVPAPQRSTSPWEIVDCRLALALDDFATQLAAHDVVEVVHYSAYRPPASKWPEGKLASRHPGALAIDAATFVKKDGTKLDVEKDFHGRIGAVPCGQTAAPFPPSPEAKELRAIVCDAADARLFNVVLTPDFNWPHRNHFHLEVTAGARWFVVR